MTIRQDKHLETYELGLPKPFLWIHMCQDRDEHPSYGFAVTSKHQLKKTPPLL